MPTQSALGVAGSICLVQIWNQKLYPRATGGARRRVKGLLNTVSANSLGKVAWPLPVAMMSVLEESISTLSV